MCLPPTLVRAFIPVALSYAHKGGTTKERVTVKRGTEVAQGRHNGRGVATRIQASPVRFAENAWRVGEV